MVSPMIIMIPVIILPDGEGSPTARSSTRWAGGQATGWHAHHAGQAYVAIPAALCRHCGLRPGDGVLLAPVTACREHALAITHMAV